MAGESGLNVTADLESRCSQTLSVILYFSNPPSPNAEQMRASQFSKLHGANFRTRQRDTSTSKVAFDFLKYQLRLFFIAKRAHANVNLRNRG